MGRVLCLLHLHSWGPPKQDEAGPFQLCTRCGSVRGSSKRGPDGYDPMPPPMPDAGSAGL
jgi:hypothetical protein